MGEGQREEGAISASLKNQRVPMKVNSEFSQKVARRHTARCRDGVGKRSIRRSERAEDEGNAFTADVRLSSQRLKRDKKEIMPAQSREVLRRTALYELTHLHAEPDTSHNRPVEHWKKKKTAHDPDLVSPSALFVQNRQESPRNPKLKAQSSNFKARNSKLGTRSETRTHPATNHHKLQNWSEP